MPSPSKNSQTMAPKKKAPRQKKPAVEAISPVAIETPPTQLKVENRGDGVVVMESHVKKIEQMAALDIAQLNSLNLPLPLPVIKPGEKGLGLGSELTRPLHGNALLEELSKMRQEKFLTDLELASKTKAFDVHKLVISSVSQFFRETLAKDPSMRRLELPSLSPLGLANVITFAYLGRVHMSLYTIGCTVSAAATLQIPQLLKMCMDFLLAELNVQTCVYIWNIAAAYSLVPVCEAARRFVLENFVQFADTPLFTQLTLEQMAAFLQDDALLLPSEPHAAELLSHIRFETIPASELVSQVQPVPRMMMDPHCHRLLVDAMNYHLLPYQQNTLQSRRTQVRAGQQTLLTVGGRPSLTERALSREVMWRDPREGGASWRHLSQLPAKSFNQCVAVMDGFLYVAGGEDQNDARNQAKHAVNTISRYDPRFNTWLHLASMRQRRTHFSLAASGGRLFAIEGRKRGGPAGHHRELPALLQHLDDACAHGRSPLLPLQRHPALRRHPGDRWLHQLRLLPLCGVLQRGHRHLEREGPDGDAPRLALLRHPRREGVRGGREPAGAGGERVDVLSVEVFSPESRSWSRAAPLLLG
ncbi:hypothetical protein KUCAC02_010854 [Chaenocephalus aceratus]|uniref:Uncharacterized protein n=1 Tax=Chaenocephalus aceratus TaxID=36190 RepID=A0ACB9WUP8_CHAAC|nr:hypothetical protein KUCAC02_010854 [Chaenocephalus aceratus]